VLIFHHAGGSALSFVPLAQVMPAGSASFLIEFPGRGRREHEGFAPDFATALADLTPTVAALVDRPTVIFGHSVGGHLAHGALGRLDARQQDLVTDLVLSSSHSPATLLAESARSGGIGTGRSRIDLMRILLDYGGCPPALFSDEELLSRAVDLLGHDLRLVDTYQAGPRPVASVTTHVWRGDSDHRVTAADTGHWREHVAGKVLQRTFPGGHFYPLQGSLARDSLWALALAAGTHGHIESSVEGA
jgi:surfactin synthase thioesterase subunit